DRTFKPRTQLANEGRGRGRIVSFELANPRLIGIDRVEHAFDPALGQLRQVVGKTVFIEVLRTGIARAGPLVEIGRPIDADMWIVLMSVADEEQGVGQQHLRRAGVSLEGQLIKALPAPATGIAEEFPATG